MNIRSWAIFKLNHLPFHQLGVWDNWVRKREMVLSLCPWQQNKSMKCWILYITIGWWDGCTFRVVLYVCCGPINQSHCLQANCVHVLNVIPICNTGWHASMLTPQSAPQPKKITHHNALSQLYIDLLCGTSETCLHETSPTFPVTSLLG